MDTENVFMVVQWEGSWGDRLKREGIKKYKFVVTGLLQGCKVQCSK